MEDQTTPRGIRNKNPLNIRHNKDVFSGEIKPVTDSAFKQFTTEAYGYRAAFVILGTYNEQGLNTIDKIIKKWAPPSENNTQVYIEKVERWSGVNRDKLLLKQGSKNDYIRIVEAMSRVENGIQANTFNVNSGFELQIKLK